MTKNKQLLGLLILLLLLPGVTTAQNSTNSPYTRYGYGQLSEQTFGKSKAMGGIAYGLRAPNHINYLNPASYTAVDSLTFLFEGGITLQNTNFSDGITKLNAKNSSFEPIAMQFRLHKKLGMTAGLLPFSSVGYNLTQYNTTNPDLENTITHAGEGGLHQLFVGLGYKIHPNLSIGLNASYLWGDIDRTITEKFTSTTIYPYNEYHNTAIGDVKIDLGLQYTQKINKKNTLVFGFALTPPKNLNNTSTITRTSAAANTITDTIAKFTTPLNIGIGTTYTYNNQLTVGLDYTLQQWSKANYMNNPNAFCDYTKIALGLEYFPGYSKRNYFSYIRYRIGTYYSQPYYKIKDIRAAKEYGITGGVALPLPNTRSLLNLSAQYIKVNGQGTNMLNENYLRINIGLTFNEQWFFKRKVN